MKKLIIILLLGSFLFSNTNIIYDPIFIYQEYVLHQVEQKKKKKIAIIYAITIPIDLFLIGLGIKSCSKNHRR